MNNENLARFLNLSGKLKEIKRTGWVEAGVSNPESVADHVFRVTLLCMILADEKSLDTLKVMRMAIIHDLSEAITGDLTPKQKTPSYVHEEKDAMNQLFNLLSDQLKQTYSDVWQEYSHNHTPESRMVHEVDKLEMLLQASEYETTRKSGTHLEHFWETEINPMYNELIKSFRILNKKD
jgi:putative hydrolase of HD superfamily